MFRHMRVNPIRAVQDWASKKKMKNLLLVKLKGQPPGSGVDVANDDPLWAVAVMELLREHPQLMAVRMKDGLMLARRVEFDGGVSDPLHRAMKSIGAIVHPGDEP